jgi:sigma-B regulation protein RsbU (phosphoserine phosphatase)
MSQALKLATTHSHTPAPVKYILLVEDEAANRELLLTMLTKAGYTVDEAADGLEAWVMLGKNRTYDLVVADRIMPKMDGLELYARMKKDSGLHHIPVIMQTGAATPENVAEGVRAGVYYYLTKPYREEALLSLVRSALREHEQYLNFNERFTQQNTMLDHFLQGRFQLRTPQQAQDLALLLGSLFPRPELAVTGLYEMLLNGIEHGMLQIGFEAKGKLLAERQWENEVTLRLGLAENRDKQITIDFTQNPEQIALTITDPGTGFDWRNYLEIEPSRATKANGRGIAKANLLSFDQVKYTGAGNVVQLISRRHG